MSEIRVKNEKIVVRYGGLSACCECKPYELDVPCDPFLLFLFAGGAQFTLYDSDDNIICQKPFLNDLVNKKIYTDINCCDEELNISIDYDFNFCINNNCLLPITLDIESGIIIYDSNLTIPCLSQNKNIGDFNSDVIDPDPNAIIIEANKTSIINKIMKIESGEPTFPQPQPTGDLTLSVIPVNIILEEDEFDINIKDSDSIIDPGYYNSLLKVSLSGSSEDGIIRLSRNQFNFSPRDYSLEEIDGFLVNISGIKSGIAGNQCLDLNNSYIIETNPNTATGFFMGFDISGGIESPTGRGFYGQFGDLISNSFCCEDELIFGLNIDFRFSNDPTGSTGLFVPYNSTTGGYKNFEINEGFNSSTNLGIGWYIECDNNEKRLFTSFDFSGQNLSVYKEKIFVTKPLESLCSDLFFFDNIEIPHTGGNRIFLAGGIVSYKDIAVVRPISILNENLKNKNTLRVHLGLNILDNYINQSFDFSGTTDLQYTSGQASGFQLDPFFYQRVGLEVSGFQFDPLCDCSEAIFNYKPIFYDFILEDE